MTGKELCEKFWGHYRAVGGDPEYRPTELEMRAWDRLAEWLAAGKCTCQSHFTECPLFVPSADDALKMRLLEEQAATWTDEEIQAIRQPGSIIVVPKPPTGSCDESHWWEIKTAENSAQCVKCGVRQMGICGPKLAPSIQVIDDPVGSQADPSAVERWAKTVAARLGNESRSALHVRVDRNLNPVACTCQSHFTECPLDESHWWEALKMRLLEERAAAFVPTPESASPKLTWRRTVPWIMQEPDTSAPVDVELPIRHECTCGEGTVKHFPDCPLA
jgi:hypothetical protein